MRRMQIFFSVATNTYVATTGRQASLSGHRVKIEDSDVQNEKHKRTACRRIKLKNETKSKLTVNKGSQAKGDDARLDTAKVEDGNQ